MSTCIVVTARLESSRFPRKALADLNGETMLGRVLRHCKSTGLDTVLAYPTGEEPLCEVARNAGVRSVPGSMNNVLARFLAACEGHDTAIRVTGDCPLIDPEHIKMLAHMFANTRDDLDYLGHYMDPDGNDVEVIRVQSLREAHADATDPHDREHVTPWIRRNRKALVMKDANGIPGNLKYSVDTPEDLALCGALLEDAGDGATYHRYVASWLRKNPGNALAP